jgi:molybdenum cofactor cytidylyltransferase
MITAIVLAAGTSSRLGRPKQLLQLGNRTVVEHVVDRVSASPVDRVVVVLGHAAEEIRRVLAGRDVETVVNESYREGQGTSLVTGVRAAIDSDAIVIVLVDQPTVTTAAIDRVIGAWRDSGAPIVMATYGVHHSHPVLFDKRVFTELLELTGDEGARSVIRRYGDQVREADSGEPDLPPDIDTEDAYREMATRWADQESKAP